MRKALDVGCNRRRSTWAFAAALGVVILGLPSHAGSAPPRRYCNGFRATLVGTARADRLPGTAGDDVIVAGGGDDVVRGLGGDDRLCGNGGDDELYGGGWADMLDGGAGDDLFAGGDAFDEAHFASASGPIEADLAAGTASGNGDDRMKNMEAIYGSPHDDVIRGGTLSIEVLWGDAGSDTVSGGPGATIVWGREGDDAISGNDGGDLLLGGLGDDTLDGGEDADLAGFMLSEGPVEASVVSQSATGEGTDSFTAVEGLFGSSYADDLTGDDAANVLIGNHGDDTIRAAAGDDEIRAGMGNDVVDAGPGDDRVEGSLDDDDIDAGLGSDYVHGGLGTDHCANAETTEGCESGGVQPSASAFVHSTIFGSLRPGKTASKMRSSRRSSKPSGTSAPSGMLSPIV
ncbi:MAG TPA: calcium-binding protein [Actinomycetota bacterium]|nr:calcium-binding protein [Actinomycetota bacterium]